jgi:hypothetical protein
MARSRQPQCAEHTEVPYLLVINLVWGRSYSLEYISDYIRDMCEQTMCKHIAFPQSITTSQSRENLKCLFYCMLWMIKNGRWGEWLRPYNFQFQAHNLPHKEFVATKIEDASIVSCKPIEEFIPLPLPTSLFRIN